MEKNERVSRRRFLERAAGATAGLSAAAALEGAAPGRRTARNEKIHVALIGCGGMGRGNLANCRKFDDVVVSGVCDVWDERIERGVKAAGGTARPFNDYRELLERDDVDGVIIATPPHWHALIAIHAAEAGKDIYLQKPMTLHPDEALAVRNAARRHGRVTQVGTQIHASENYRRVVEWIRSGRLGKVSAVRTFNVMNQGPEGIGPGKGGDPPAGLDWDSWIGPGPKRAFDELIVRDAYHHCSFFDYSGGWTPGMAPHIVDLPWWALELGFPRVTSCSGGRWTIHDAGDAPDTQEVLWQHDGLTVTWSMSLVNSFGFDFGRGEPARRLGIYFHAVNGTLFADYSKHEVVPEGKRLASADPPEKSIPPSPGHEREWLDAISTRRAPSCSFDYHAKIDVALGLANIACRLGRSVRFDPERERITQDEEARKLARPVYREPYRFPAKYLETEA